jgi:hypothetical protein
MKYRIEKSDLFINNKLYPEGIEVDLTKDQTQGIENFLIPVSNPESTEGHPELDSGSVFISGSSSVSESDSNSHPEQVYAVHSRSIEGSNIKETKTKINPKGNKK